MVVILLSGSFCSLEAAKNRGKFCRFVQPWSLLNSELCLHVIK